MRALACLLAAIAAWLLTRPAMRPAPAVGWARAGSATGWRIPVVVAVLAVIAGVLALTSGAHLVLALTGIGVAVEVAGHLRRARARAVAARRTGLVVAACEGIAADLAAGRAPLHALRDAVRDWPELAPVARAAGLDADVPAALRRLAVLPGAGQCRVLAAAWQVADRSGAGLASTMEMAAATARREREIDRLVRTELASARATARLLAVLPVGVLVLASGVGGDPWPFLIGTPAGLGCLIAGLVLAAVGLRWLDRIGAGAPGR